MRDNSRKGRMKRILTVASELLEVSNGGTAVVSTASVAAVVGSAVVSTVVVDVVSTTVVAGDSTVNELSASVGLSITVAHRDAWCLSAVGPISALVLVHLNKSISMCAGRDDISTYIAGAAEGGGEVQELIVVLDDESTASSGDGGSGNSSNYIDKS